MSVSWKGGETGSRVEPAGCAARRRVLLLRGLGAGLAGMVPAVLADPPVRTTAAGRTGRTGSAGGGAGIVEAAVPPVVVSLADHGGRPGVGRSMLVSAFRKAFAALAGAGGGTLLVPPGVYDFGSHADADDIILCRNLRNVAISAYGATFQATTTARVMPHLFYFFNFQNVSIVGATFTDPGFTPWFNWKGMYCVGLQADSASSRFRMVDCQARRVVGLLASNNDAAGRRFISDVSVQGSVEEAYYGVGASFIREGVKAELACHNVRRAFIANALKDADIVVKSSNTSGWPGSNGLVALVSSGASSGNVENVRVKVSVSGDCIHSSYVHFYHQGEEREGYMRDIDATVDVYNLRRARNLFVFDHETDAVQRRTARVWDRIALHGSVVGKFTGRVLSNTSATSASGTVWVDRNLAKLGKPAVLPAGFRVRPH